MADYQLTFQTVSIPTGSGGASVTIEEDNTGDGTPDVTETVALSDGVTSYTTSSGAFAGSGQVRLSWSLGPSLDVETTSATVVPADVTPAPPNAPEITVSEVSDTPSVVLSWPAVATADEYRVYRATSPGSTLSDYTHVGTTTSAGYTDTTASLGTRYYYRVTAYNTSTGESELSNEVRAEPNADEFTESITWGSESEWGYGSFTDTTTNGTGSVILGDRPPTTFDYSLDAAEKQDGEATAEIRDANTGTVLASDTTTNGGEATSTFTIDTSARPNLEFYVFVQSVDGDPFSGIQLESTASISFEGSTLVSVSDGGGGTGGTSSNTATESYTYADTGSWTSPYWDFTNTTTATKLYWTGVTVPNSGDDVTVTVENSDGTSTYSQSLTGGSGSTLFQIAADDQYRLVVDVTTANDDTTPELGGLTLETHTPTDGNTLVDTRQMEVDLAWNPVSVCDGYQVLYSESTPVTASDSVGFENADSAATSGTVTGLKQGETYYFNVRPKYSGE